MRLFSGWPLSILQWALRWICYLFAIEVLVRFATIAFELCISTNNTYATIFIYCRAYDVSHNILKFYMMYLQLFNKFTPNYMCIASTLKYPLGTKDKSNLKYSIWTVILKMTATHNAGRHMQTWLDRLKDLLWLPYGVCYTHIWKKHTLFFVFNAFFEGQKDR